MPFIPIWEVNLPNYNVNNEPNHDLVGKNVEKLIEKKFLNKKIAIRAIGSVEHPEKTQDELIEIIKKLGHDRYDPIRVGDRYVNIENKQIDIFALDFVVNKDFKFFGQFTYPFYHWGQKSRGFPIKIDILIIYDFHQLEVVEHRYACREDIKRDGFRFKYPKYKPAALLGIIKIT